MAGYGREQGGKAGILPKKEKRKKRNWVGFWRGHLCPFAFLIFLFFKTNIQVLPLGEKNSARSLETYFKEGLLPGLRGRVQETTFI